ncbi:UBA-like protein [Dioscorea alata]|uniref:UBA-like protein n=1 Tax=Dioscorea alata TaxID=55571 RepID=A0ACB7UHX6_DIOAL|nr:UBA-like protein [Dioscorea alata]
MSAVVLGKRSNSFFEELHHHSPSSPSSSSPFDTSLAKRVRRSSSSSSPTRIRFSPPRPSLQSPQVLVSSGGFNSEILDRLRSLFPDMDHQILQRALEAAGNDLDSAIKSLNNLHLKAVKVKLPSALGESVPEAEPSIEPPNEGSVNGNFGDVTTGISSVPIALPTDGPEWVDLFVREMMSANNVDDARARASRVLEVLEKSIMARVTSEAMQNFEKENIVLKEQMKVLLHENNILKRAVAIQHERQKEYEARNQELQHLKQLVVKYQEQLRTLEVNNYALAMHLKQAQESSSMPGRFHPDIF